MMSRAQRDAWNHVARYKHHRLIASTFATSLRDLEDLEAAVQAQRVRIVAAMRDAGCGWAEVGEALGVSRQAAQQRYGRLVSPERGRKTA